MSKWTFEPGHTAASFAVRHMMVTWVRGLFGKVQGTLDVDLERPVGGSLHVEIDAAGIWTGDEARDEHLQAADFLDVEKHPKITYDGSVIHQTGETEVRVGGDLVIRGVSRPVEMQVRSLGQWATPWWEGNKDLGPKTRAGFTGTARINRQDFGISWNGDLENGGVVVGNDVLIILDGEAILEG